MKLRAALLLGSALILTAHPLTASTPIVQNPAITFIAPTGPMVLTRELRRTLVDGKEVVSRRSYRIAFVPDGQGFRVDGTLISSEVEAPPVLSMLADLERARKDEGLFPLHLDRNGVIVRQQGAHDPATSQAARAIVGSALEKIAFAPSEQRAAADMTRRIVSQVSTAGGNWPADLFCPIAGQQTQRRTADVPGTAASSGSDQGVVTLTVTSTTGPTGLLNHLERRVVTELEGTRREVRESWVLHFPS